MKTYDREERVAHTPQQKDFNLPWHVYSGGNFDKVVPEGYDEQVERTHYLGGAICEMDDWNGVNHTSPEARTRATERAAFIVTACNAHEALVDALRALTDFIEKNPKKQAILSFPYKQARAALSQAGAK